MKHLWLGIGILAALLGLCILSGSLLGAAVDRADRQLQTAWEAALDERYADAAQVVAAARAVLEDSKGLLGVLQRHSELDELQFALASLEQYARAESGVELLAALARVRESLHHLKEMEKPAYYNFL